MLEFKENILLSDFTTIKLGGKAKYFCECINEEQILECLEFAKKGNLRLQVLGGGSNTIFADEGFDGIILKTAMRNITLSGKGGSSEVIVTAEAGVNWDDFVIFCTGQGFAGVECLSGIPGTVGATPIQNVGAYGQEVSEIITEVTAIEISTHNKLVFSNPDCRFDYRQSRFKSDDAGKYIITEVKFLLKRNGEPAIRYPELKKYLEDEYVSEENEKDNYNSLTKPIEKLKFVRNAVIEIRKKKSMVVDQNDPDSVSCGSFFMNPILTDAEFQNFELKVKNLKLLNPVIKIPHFVTDKGIKIPAAWLIENAGFKKGYKKNGAGISSKHTLAIINCGGKTKNIMDLAEDIEERVHTLFGISLKREPVVIY
jgi:UDP-N-acetylmuramate dehydrogenase